MANLSKQSIQELRKTVNEAMREAPAPPGGVAAAEGDFDFCSVWKTAKPILQIIAALPLPIPGLSAAIHALITVGDQICQGP